MGLLAVAAVAAGAVLVLGGGGAAVADTEVPTSLVEDFAYPEADAILAEHGVRVHTGDGNITFVPAEAGACAPGLIRVETALDEEPWLELFCFATSGARGFLTLEVPHSFLVRAAAAPLRATTIVPADGTTTGEVEREVHDVPANRSVSVEAGDGVEAPSAVLVELRFGAW